MTPETPHQPRRARVPFVVAGVVAAVLAAGLIAAGGAVLWLDGKKDDQGFITTRSHRFDTRTAALATENMDVNLDGAQWLVNADHYGKVRVHVTPQGGRPVFVGIGRTSDVTAYLGGVAHTTVTDIEADPLRAHYRDSGGRATRVAAPASRRIWSASANGAGPQTVTWNVADGNWSVVVMNADGSPGVHAGVRAGAKVAYLAAVGWSTVGGGVLLLAGAAALITAGMRPRRGGTRAPVIAPGYVTASR
jgi:hypothetical protein